MVNEMILNLSYIIDGVILLFLAVTIGYAVYLSRAFSQFKKSRQEFDAVLQDLIQAIVHAEASIKMLKSTAENMGEELQEKINESRALFDELQIINEGGNGLAERLEFLAEQASVAVQGLELASVAGSKTHINPETKPKPKSKHPKATVKEQKDLTQYSDKLDDVDIFSIRDPDYERGDDGTAIPFDFDDGDWPNPDTLQSKAERDLYETLKKIRK